MRAPAMCAVLLAAAAACVGFAGALPADMSSLPPNATANPSTTPVNANATATAANDTDDELLNRFGDNDGIQFAPSYTDDLRPQAVLEQQHSSSSSVAQQAKYGQRLPNGALASSISPRLLGVERNVVSTPLSHRRHERDIRDSWEKVQHDVARGVAQLSLNLQGALGGGNGNGSAALRDNVVFSPLSVAAALALVLLGAGGRTYDEVSQVLGLVAAGGPSLTPERDATVHQHFGRLLSRLTRRAATSDASEALSALGVFTQKGLSLRPRFTQVARQAYHSDVTELDFQRHPIDAQTVVNAWVSEKTRGRIADMLPHPPPPATRLVLASALYFNGHWQHPFPRETTQRRPFYVDGDASGETLSVDMMANSADLPYAEDATLGCKVLGLPYRGGDVAMYVVLPNARGIQALQTLQSRLTLQALDRLLNAARVVSDVIVVMPRTKLDFVADLREPLYALGLRTLFDPTAANLTQLADANASTNAGVYTAGDPLFVDEVLHKVEVEITETGTVASAATLATVTRDGSHRSVRADRPFLFFIRHQPSGLLLFWGSVVRPRPAQPVP